MKVCVVKAVKIIPAGVVIAVIVVIAVVRVIASIAAIAVVFAFIAVPIIKAVAVIIAAVIARSIIAVSLAGSYAVTGKVFVIIACWIVFLRVDRSMLIITGSVGKLGAAELAVKGAHGINGCAAVGALAGFILAGILGLAVAHKDHVLHEVAVHTILGVRTDTGVFGDYPFDDQYNDQKANKDKNIKQRIVTQRIVNTQSLSLLNQITIRSHTSSAIITLTLYNISHVLRVG